MGSCDQCETGTFVDKEGQIGCSECGAGNFSSNVLSCEPCSPGTAAPSAGMGVCDACEPGK